MKKRGKIRAALRARFDPGYDAERYLRSAETLRKNPGAYSGLRIASAGAWVFFALGALAGAIIAFTLPILILLVAPVLGSSIPLIEKIAAELLSAARSISGSSDPPFDKALWALMGAGFLVLLAAWALLTPKLSNWRLGEIGERITAQCIRNAARRPDWHIFHGFQVPNGAGDIDHIVVCPKGIFAFETKALRGHKIVQQSGDKLFLDGKPLERWNPIRQAKKNAASLHQWLSRRLINPIPGVTAIVCFPDKNVDFSGARGDTAVMNPEKIANFFAARGDVLDGRGVREIAAAIAAQERDGPRD